MWYSFLQIVCRLAGLGIHFKNCVPSVRRPVWRIWLPELWFCLPCYTKENPWCNKFVIPSLAGTIRMITVITVNKISGAKADSTYTEQAEILQPHKSWSLARLRTYEIQSKTGFNAGFSENENVDWSIKMASKSKPAHALGRISMYAVTRAVYVLKFSRADRNVT